jgi:D-alanyl-D-alanine carboxypeptidase
VYAYQYKGKKRKQDRTFHIENFHAAGCMYSTSTDLLKLDQALYTTSLLTEKSYALLATSYPEYGYVGYSVWNYQYPFVDSQPTVMERRGGIWGTNVVLIRLTDSNHTIIILSNNDRFNPDSFGDPTNLREKLIRVCSEGPK